MNRLDHQRAKLAAELVDSIESSRVERYAALSKRAAGLLRECGLLQSAAFWLSKKRDTEERQYLEHLVRGIGAPEARTAAICREGSGRLRIEGAEQQTIRALLQRSGPELALVEEEAREIAAWLKRLAEGRKQDEAAQRAAQASTGEKKEARQAHER